jgi:hypothetical protein
MIQMHRPVNLFLLCSAALYDLTVILLSLSTDHINVLDYLAL